MSGGKLKKNIEWCIIAIIIVTIVFISILGRESNIIAIDTKNKKVSSSDDIKGKKQLQTILKKGGVLETYTLKISFLNCGEYKNYKDYAKPHKGKKIIFATFEFENISDSDQYVSAYEFSCYADGYDCESYYFSDEDSIDAALSAGKKTKGTVLFEVPKDAKEINLEYEISFETLDKIIFVVQ